jgi:co-chaperonin GroES (HSP10)
MKALGYRIIVEEIQEENKSGLFLGKQVSDGVTRAKVITYGDLVKDKPEVGSTIQFKTSLGTKVLIQGHEYWSIDENSILVVE